MARAGWLAGLDRGPRRRQHDRGRHPHLPAHRDRRDGAEGAGAAAGGQNRPLRVAADPGARADAAAAGRGAQRDRQRAAAARRHPPAAGRDRALPHHRRAPVHHPGEPGRRACCAAKAARFCASCSSSATSPPARSWCRACCWSGSRSAPRPTSCARIVRTHPHTRYPVYQGDLDHIIGSLHIKDLLRHLLTGRPVTDRDARPLPYVPGPAYLDAVLAAMRRSQRADGGGDGPARRHGRPRDDGGSVRGGRRRDRRRPRAGADSSRRPGPSARPRHGQAARTPATRWATRSSTER